MTSYLPLCLCLLIIGCTSSSYGKRPSHGRCLRKKPVQYKIEIDLNLNTCKRRREYPPKLNYWQSIQVCKLFPHLFMSKNDYNELLMKMNKHQPTSDGDMCCPTQHEVVNATSLKNVDGQWRSLVHLTILDKWQFVHYGSCLHDGCLTGTGKCVEENTAQFLLVWDLTNPTLPFSFDAFYIPTYCSCKNI